MRQGRARRGSEGPADKGDSCRLCVDCPFVDNGRLRVVYMVMRAGKIPWNGFSEFVYEINAVQEVADRPSQVSGSESNIYE